MASFRLPVRESRTVFPSKATASATPCSLSQAVKSGPLANCHKLVQPVAMAVQGEGEDGDIRVGHAAWLADIRQGR